jgi:hypothetical protein
MFSRSLALALLGLSLVAPACSGGTDETADLGLDLAPADQVADLEPDLADDLPPPPDAEPDLADALPELVPVEDLEPEDIPPEDLGPVGPVTESTEPEKVAIEKWLVTYIPDPNKDPVGDALDQGTFLLPEGPGKDANGVEWVERIPGENGKMGYAGYGLFYAATAVELEKDAGIIVRADRFMQVYVNGAPQPGDPYMTRKHRTPGVGKAGTNVVVASAYMAINDPEIELWTTPDELAFNTGDVTAPHLVAGAGTSQHLGIAVLNLTPLSLRQATARVVGNEWFEETEIPLPALPPAAVTQVPFLLELAQVPAEGGLELPVTVRIESPVLEWSWEKELTVPTVEPGVPYKRTRRANVDGSVQYAGINPPSGEAPPEGHALVLSLHGASVEGIGQAKAYGQKEWAYVVAPTNRRPFGFDWEEWGRMDGLEALDDAMEAFGIDPTRVYVSGHSMGGHGTWQFGVHLGNRFRVVGPSAGWSSFYSYVGATKPTGAFARARASSDTLNYVDNLANRAVYVIHGDADDNVPISEAYLMQDAVEPVADEYYFHVQPGAGHWWDGPEGAGADCVDWPELFQWMEERTLDLTELDFEYRSPSPWVNATYSYVTIRSQLDPYEDSVITSSAAGDAVTLLTSNVRSMVLDGAALLDKGVTSLTVDDEAVELAAGPLAWGPQAGKNPQVQGPFNQVFHRPFCFVYEEQGHPTYRNYVSYLVSTWNIIGNGHACALPVGKLTPEIRAENNLIYVGIPDSKVPVPDGMDFAFDADGLAAGEVALPAGTLLFVFPQEGHLSAVMTTTAGQEFMLYWYSPFSSRAGMPDYVGWTTGGAHTAGFFDAEWQLDPALGVFPQ